MGARMHEPMSDQTNSTFPPTATDTGISAMRMRKCAVLPDGRVFDLTGLQIGYVVEGKRGEEWRPLQWKKRLCIFAKPKLAAAFMSGRNRP
jgi:hypothetical protein